MDGSILLKVSMPWINFDTCRSKQTFKHVNMGTIIVFNEQFVHKMKGLSPWLCFMENIREIYQYVCCFCFKFGNLTSMIIHNSVFVYIQDCNYIFGERFFVFRGVFAFKS